MTDQTCHGPSSDKSQRNEYLYHDLHSLMHFPMVDPGSPKFSTCAEIRFGILYRFPASEKA